MIFYDNAHLTTTRITILLPLTILLLAFTLKIANAEKRIEQGKYELEVKNSLINIQANNVNFKEILRELEKKIGIKVEILDGVEDRKVSLNIKSLPSYALNTLLEKMSLKNAVVVYDQKLATNVIYIIPEGEDITNTIKEKTAIIPADFADTTTPRGFPLDGLITISEQNLNITVQGDYVETAIMTMNNLVQEYTENLTNGIQAQHTEFVLDKIQNDNLGYRHIRLQQRYKGLAVIGGESIVHINNQNIIYNINGKSCSLEINASVEPDIDPVTSLQVGLEEQKDKAGLRISSKPSLVIYGRQLAYHYVISYEDDEHGLWWYYIDAHTGKLINRYNNIQDVSPDQARGYNASVNGHRLTGEDGSSVSMSGFYDSVGSGWYFLYNFDKKWGVYDNDVQDWEQDTSSNWGTFDRAAVSVAKNMEDTQDWVTNVLERNSYDNAGAFAKAIVHLSEDYTSAYWNGESFNFGDGDGRTANELTVLDIVAHEYGHAITQFTSNLVYTYESGALNESFSDIMGTLVEFAKQTDGTAVYPSATPGHSDWLCGEDSRLPGPGNAFRDMKNPQRYQQPSYYQGTYWYTESDDNGGVHTNSGVQNFAFYLLAVGGSGTNDGYSYGPITGLGVIAAGQIAMRANMVYLTSSSLYTDARNAWISAAQDLGYSTATVEAVWDACGVSSSPPPPPSGDSYEPDNSSTQAKIITPGIWQYHSINPDGDEDWLKFTLESSSEVELFALQFYDENGFLRKRMWLYDNNLNLIEYNDNDGRFQSDTRIDRVCGTDELPAGTYYVKIDGFDDQTIFDYSIYLTVSTCSEDSYEPDNSSAQTTIITSGSTQTHSIYPFGDEDWVTFTLTAPSGIYLQTDDFYNSNTRMWLYDSNLNLIEFNDNGAKNLFASIDRTCGTDELPAGTYFAKIDEHGNDNVIASYNLSLNVLSCWKDSYEPDNSSIQAKTITSGNTQTHSINPVGDEDWVKFTLANTSGVVIETSGVLGDTDMWLYDSNFSLIEFNHLNTHPTGAAFAKIDRVWGTDELPAGTYYVKISKGDTYDWVNTSNYDILLTVATCSVTVTSPNGGDYWKVGKSHNITWDSYGNTSSNVKIEYSINFNGGSDWRTIADSTPNDGSYNWTVPNEPSKSVRVRVTSIFDNTCTDTSNLNFRIFTATTASFPFTEDFEAGTLSSHWLTNSSFEQGRIQVTTDNGPRHGRYHLTMDDSIWDFAYSSNDLILTIDLSDQSDVGLKFHQKDFNHETYYRDTQVVSVSADGSTWYKIKTTRSANNYQEYTIDLDAVISFAGISYNNAFMIRFNQTGRGPIDVDPIFGTHQLSDGYAIDDIRLTSILSPTWTDTVGVTVNGNSITKNAPAAWGNSGAASQESFIGDGGVAFTVPMESLYQSRRIVGLSSTNRDAGLDSINYGIYIDQNSRARAYENGVSKRSSLSSTFNGDRYSIERIGSNIVYKRNSIIFYISTNPTDAPLLVDVAIYDNDATINNVRLRGIGGDTDGPVVSAPTSSKNPINEGETSITISTTVDDSTKGNSNIAGAEYYVGTDPGNGSGTAMTPTDGTFDSVTENVYAIINTSSWTAANSPYVVNVRGKNTNGDWGSTQSVSVTVIAPDISVLPISHNFGSVKKGSTSTAQTCTVTNSGTAIFITGALSLTGTDKSEFIIQNDNCSRQTITPSSSRTVEVVFKPTTVGPKSASLSIPYNDPNAPTLNVQLSGTGFNPDTDNDGILDSWEITNFGDLTTANATTDFDGDGLLDIDENANNTDPKNTDSDGDGMNDSWEVTYGLNPLVDDRNGDLDGDGLTNKEEYDLGTDPSIADLTVTTITPAYGRTGTSVDVTNLTGSGFLNGATVKLTKTGEVDIITTNVTVYHPTQITCTCDLTGATTGLWNVVVDSGGESATLNDVFMVKECAPTCSISLTGTASAYSVDFCLDNPCTDPNAIELKVWSEIPGTILIILNVGDNSSIVLPAGFNTCLTLIPPTLSLPTGMIWGTRLIDPKTGEELSLDKVEVP